MARVNIPVQTLDAHGGVSAGVTWTSGDATNDHYFANDGRVILLVKNADASPHTATVVSVPNRHARTGDKTMAVSAGATGMGGFFPTHLFNQSDGTVYVNLDTSTSVSLAAVRIA